MRLLDVRPYRVLETGTGSLRIDEPYVIISHRWLPGGSEIVFSDMPQLAESYCLSGSLQAPPGKEESLRKLHGACETVKGLAGQNVNYVWLDTICIDKSSSSEVSESLNSMYMWYTKAERCLAYMSDYQVGSPTSFINSEWFDRGWTMQELVAPSKLEFYDANWRRFGDRSLFTRELAQKTGMRSGILSGQITATHIYHASISHRMSWAARRTMTRKEDIAYCSMGVFDVNMPVLYGEGMDSAFRRLQEEIIKYSIDHSIFAWTIKEDTCDDSASLHSRDYGLLAPSPQCFAETGHFARGHGSEPYVLTNKGLEISLRMFEIEGKNGKPVSIASLNCPVDRDHVVGIYLQRDHWHSGSSNQYRRVFADTMQGKKLVLQCAQEKRKEEKSHEGN